ncbi:YihY/virulence factor BrkB family protein [Nocardioides sp. STR2]|uniref:YihY/virulence factor BrkB family protein n=1 Tax=Nocardioides pini TaxID=2975053 RepID=A0ABT4CDY4_9ACTN|nr:YhjD/YihY/BrkB family envelope integrity protein [Nocardioides pini]MCY4726354.1 YihY/virulence factor BrkB family protein [Nocardioides pini]
MHPSPSPEQEIRLQRALDALPMPLQQTAVHLLESWPGRVVTRTAWNLQRIEIFDRAMTVAAQLFTSIFPILILLASWSGNTGRLFTDTLAMPPEAESQVDLALKESSSTAFGVVGAVIVLVSATSLSRALARAFAKVWSLPKPTSSPKEAWRWVAVVLGIALSLVALRRSQTIADGIPPPHLWAEVVALALLVLVAGFTPWVLLKGVVSARALATGAALFGVVMLLVRPVTEIWLARALESSATRYGSIGVAFTYLAWLYVIAWILLATAVLGQVLVTDDGRIGRFLAGGKDLVRLQPTTSVSSSGADASDRAPDPAD